MAKRLSQRDYLLKENKMLHEQVRILREREAKERKEKEIQKEIVKRLQIENEDLNERVVAAEQKLANGRLVWN